MSERDKSKASFEAEEELNEITAEDADTDDLKHAAGRFVKTAGGLAGSFGKLAVKKGSELKEKLEDEEFQNKAKSSALGFKNKAAEAVVKVADRVSERADVQDDAIDVESGIPDSVEEQNITFSETKSDVIEDGYANVETEESHEPVQKEHKSNFIKEELNKRAEEKKAFEAAVRDEKVRLEQKRQNAKKSALRKIKVVDSISTKRETKKDAEQLEKFRAQEEERIAAERAARQKQIVKNNKKPIAIVAACIIAVVAIAAVAMVHSHNVALERNYSSAVEAVINEDYSTAATSLKELSYKDSDALAQYSEYQADIDSYNGKAREMYKLIEGIDGIENAEVLEQYNHAVEQLGIASDTQSSIDGIKINSLDDVDKVDFDSIDNETKKLDERYRALLNTDRYDHALKVKGYIKDDAEVVKLINEIDSLGDVTLESGDKIAELKERYKKLSDEDKNLVFNKATLDSAESKYKELVADKKKKEEEEKQKAEEEKAQKEEDAAKDNYTVYITSGERYHFDGCSRMGSKNKRAVTQGWAIANGYYPCQYCVNGHDVPSYYYVH